MSVLGGRVRQRRDHLEMTQEQLAELINKDQKQIWKYETGRTQPNAPALIDLARALNTTADYLLGLTDNPERPLRNSHDLTDTEKEIIHMLRAKPPEWERKFLDFIRVG